MRSKTSDKLSVNIDHVHCTLKFQWLFCSDKLYIGALNCIINKRVGLKITFGQKIWRQTDIFLCLI